eukprot:TRINITY_DN10057_c0_g1_i1.p1 TRINITY_DN10057_c0_g1~~TRINITY_DN10057_c0_g1_i1.p1  ORF type:complete len:508 (-),score=104.88 TRINITY_DN10057_c0_g1_i1:349-1872(-)
MARFGSPASRALDAEQGARLLVANAVGDASTNLGRSLSGISDSMLPTDSRSEGIQVASACSHQLVAAMILMNTILIAIEASFIQDDNLKPTFRFLETCFTIFYTAEISLRLHQSGCVHFFSGHDGGWNLFDLIVTVFGIVDVAMLIVGGGSVKTNVGRVFRVLRILRVFRTMRFLAEIDYVLQTASKATLKLAGLVSLVVFVSAIVTTNLLWDAPDTEVAEEFADLGSSMWSIFKLMTLDNWIETVERILKAKPSMFFFFVCFIFSASIAIMSLVPAIFIEVNMYEKEKKAKKQKEVAKAAFMQTKKELLQYLFSLADDDGDGRVTTQELGMVLEDTTIMTQLRKQGLLTGKDQHLIRLRLFELWEQRQEGLIELDENGVTEEEFLYYLLGVLYGDGIDMMTVWQSTTSTRLKLRQLQEEIAQVRGSMPSQINGRRADVVKNGRQPPAVNSSSDEAVLLRQELAVARRAIQGAQNAADVANRRVLELETLLSERRREAPENASSQLI